MNIELNLKDIFCSSEDPCDLEDAIREEVVAALVNSLRDGLRSEIKQQVAKVFDEELRAYVKELLQSISTSLLDTEYTPVTQYGAKSSPTTFRNALVEQITAAAVYKKQTYDSDKNAFTKAVDQAVSDAVGQFKTELKKEVDALYVKEVLKEAEAALKKKLGI